MSLDLPLVWASILALGVFMYVLLDGFDLGVGILFPLGETDAERDVMMNSVAPVWDGNETWLVLGGGGLLAVFPLAYAVIMPALYFPVLLMLIALIFRGVAFEFRFKAPPRRRWLWDHSFNLGSVVATFSQGLVLGGFLQGFEVAGRDFAGGPFDWLSPFTVFVGLALICGYALLGATWLIIKTEGELQERFYRLARPLLLGVVLFIVAVSVWTPLKHPAIAERWFSWPNLLYLSPVPIVTALVALLLLRALRRRREVQPFVLSLALFLLCYLGLGISLWPYAAPPSITIWDAASDPSSQLFLLVGTLFLLPFILFYTGYAYFVFRGKVREGEGYH
ncbi:MAG: cytochrome d ubiquinol oxidase subunit II [Xanthomonadaceae bacterium]|nr:cytochrome d ubiquinol oxidase subunit II [Xanthomonadaceae bacterium]